jgi:REP element-mobilizing transposase RayT
LTEGKTIHKGWHSRGYLPHFDEPDLVQSISFHLADSIPTHVYNKWKSELGWHGDLSPADPIVMVLQKRLERYADAGYGGCHLRDPVIGNLMEETMLLFDAQRYRLIAWCIMPNHVHAVIELVEGHSLSSILHSWKSFTAKEANKILNRSGQFWMDDYFDRYVRDAEHFATVISYVEQNPVKARLVTQASEWKFSSAAWAKAGEGARDPSSFRR